jgi:hypothetical protein
MIPQWFASIAVIVCDCCAVVPVINGKYASATQPRTTTATTAAKNKLTLLILFSFNN